MSIGPARPADPACCEVLRLEVHPGLRPSGLPPVRIFVGTEPAQYRAERVLLWSIERVRDPRREYRIHLMKELPGFRRWLWNTGFTNYRFAVPELAGGSGRAIYNDVDQVYLADPALLFDMPLEGHGFRAIDPRDTSVMLLDCERMRRHWNLDSARSRRKHGLVRSALSEPGIAGALPAEWNARDHEALSGASPPRLLHYTTLHKQPWQPFPERFYYRPNPAARIWLDLERAADAAGYRPARSGSAGTRPKPASTPRLSVGGGLFDGEVRDLVARTGARTLLEILPGDGPLEPTSRPAWGGLEVDRVGLRAALPDRQYDGVVCSARLDALPTAELPRTIASLCERARHFVLAAAVCAPPARPRVGRPPRGTVHQPAWWSWMFRSATVRHPALHWRLATTRRRDPRAPVDFDTGRVELLQGGAFPGAANGRVPRVWVLTDHKPGHTTQSVGLADELGWPWKRIDLAFNLLQELPNAWTRGSLRTLTRACARSLEAPWPDLVIATGRRTAPVASWIREQSRGRTRTVQMGRIGAFRRDVFDLAVAPAYASLYPDARRVETAAPVTRVSPRRLEEAAARFSVELASAPIPRIALLVGGPDPEHELRDAHARQIAEAVAELAEREGGTVWVSTSRRTDASTARILEQTLGERCGHFHRWSAATRPEDNPYLGFLALADALVVTGESASMLSEACATGKPVYIFPLVEASTGLRNRLRRLERRIADRVTARAYARPVNRRNFERPQRGVELASAMLLAHGFVRTSGHSKRLHEVLVQRGLARVFDGKLAPPPADRLDDLELVAHRVRELVGVPPTPGTDPGT